jgi:hypothetical protein
MRNLQPDFIKQQISALLVLYPELAEDIDLRLDTIEGETDALTMIDRWIKAIEESKILLDGAEIRVKELIERVKRFERRIEALREGIRMIMQAAELHKLERPTATLYFAKSQPKVMDITGSNFDLRSHPHLADEFVITSRAISKSLIAAALKAGENIEGFQLSNSEPHLHVKTK